MSPITFVTVGLTAGAALAAVPVIIHLVMRQTPKHIIFPALRLIKERQKQSRKRLRIRNWLLLAARMLLIALMALALARPRLYSSTSLGDREVPTALGLVFDTSLSMEYTEKDKTRLREAQDRALEVLKKAHESSQVFVVDSAEPGVPVALSPAAARKRVEGLTIRPVNRSLNPAVGLAYKAIAPSELPRREVYVFSDMARSAWDLGPGKAVEGLDVAKKSKEGVATYLIKLSPPGLRDAAVIDAQVVGGLAIKDEPVQVTARVRSVGPAARRRVELWIDDTPRDRKEVEIPANGEAEVPPFTPIKLEEGPHQLDVRLTGEPDPLKFDDRRYFTVDVQPAQRVLLLYENPDDAYYVAEALDPSVTVAGAPRPYRVTRLVASGLEAQPAEFLRDFACVFVLNVSALPDSQWSRLNQYVRRGGGLVIAMGDRVQPARYNEGMAAALMPAKIDEPFPRRVDTTFGDGDWNHPILSKYREEVQKNLASVPVYRRAAVTPVKGARTILEFQDKAPALIERSFPGARTGRVLLWTTALSRRAELKPDNAPEYWTDFPFTSYWSFLAVLDQTIPYVAGLEGRKLTYEAGEDVVLPVDPSGKFTSYAVRGPDSKTSDRLGEPAGNAALVIVAPSQIGAWTVVASGPGGASRTLKFSVNAPAAEEQIAPADDKEIKGLFGDLKNVVFAAKAEELKTAQDTVRIGREVFPWIMALILVLVTAENYLANKFYRERPAAVAGNAAPSARAG